MKSEQITLIDFKEDKRIHKKRKKLLDRESFPSR